MAEAAARFGLPELKGTFPALDSEDDPDDKHLGASDVIRLVGTVAFTSGGTDGRPLLECNYGVKIIVPREFPQSRPRVYSTDGQVPDSYHTYPSGELCLGAPLELIVILRKAPTLLGYVTRALVPFLYRHRYTIEHEPEGPPGWDDLEHGTPGLLQYYGDKLGVSDYGACVALLHQAGQRQQKKGRRERCPCGSGQALYECHYERMLALRRSVGREAVRKAYLELRVSKAPPSMSEAEDSPDDQSRLEEPAS